MAPELGPHANTWRPADPATGRAGLNRIPSGTRPLQGEYAQIPHIPSRFGGDPLVITPRLTDHNRDLATSLGLVNPRAGPQLRA